ncbi:hypothetical protein P4O66_000389 [Electrophorus voltai]|uniref:Homeobox domain-containing protein n=1 Tax=Electrophorus voltai TaxID=2609070 RepID=A0AAD8ZL83_9TELE|nr:hypothetical protein P4O66_000389 [Electrophorus voltai]
MLRSHARKHNVNHSTPCNMASKRKSTIPCMIPSKNKHLRDEIMLGCLPELLPTIPEDSILSISGQEEEEQKIPLVFRHDGNKSYCERGTYSCPPCGFEMSDLNLFLNHMDSSHMDFHTQPIFYCLNCKVSLAKFEGLALHNAKIHPKLHTAGSPGKVSLQVTKRDGVIRVEQTLFTEREDFSETGISITKTPIMKMMVKGEHKKIVVSHTVEVQRPEFSVDKAMTVANGTTGRNFPPSKAQVLTGTGSVSVMKLPNTHGIPVTQNLRHSIPSGPISNSDLPKVMIPLSSIPTYDPAMDLSSFLKTSFGKFPYPTKAELCYLTVVSGFPEEQIKLWFTAQRLKQGISWSPEEIEDTRRKMFNTVFQATPKSSQRQSYQQSPQHCVSVKSTSASSGYIPHAPKCSLIGWKGGVIVTQPGITQVSPLRHQSVVDTPQVTVRHGIFTKETGNGLFSMKAESSSVSRADHRRGEKTETGTSGPGTTISIVGGTASASVSTSANQMKNSSYTDGSIMNLTNIVRKIDCNVNHRNTNCTSKSYTSSSSICGQENLLTTDKKESSNCNIATSSNSSNGSIYKSTSHSTICTKKEGNISDYTSKARNTDSNVTCSSTGADGFSPVLTHSLSVQTGSLLDPFLSKSKSKLPEELETLKQSIIQSPFSEQSKLMAAMDVPIWEADKPYSSSLTESQLAAEPLLSNMPTTSFCSDDSCLQEDKNKPSSKSLPAQVQKLSPKTILGASQVPSPDFTAIHYRDHEPPALEDAPQPSKVVVDMPNFNSKVKQRETDDRFLEQQKSQTNKMFCNTNKDEHSRIVHMLHTLEKDESKKMASGDEILPLQQHKEELDHWEESSYYDLKNNLVKISSFKPLKEQEHTSECNRKKTNNQQLDEDDGSNYENGSSKWQASHQFVEDDKYINKHSKRHDDQTNSKKNLEGKEETVEKAPPKDHWLMKDGEHQQDTQSRKPD